MTLKEIYKPISKELFQVEKELISVVSRLTGTEDSQQIVNHFFKVPGKRLRPALVLLSSRAVSPNQLINQSTNQLIPLATAVELIHSASLIHDDIVDDDSFRREQPSMNKQFGNQIAVLAGDMLYIRAFSLLSDKFDKKMLTILSHCVEKMCYGEINELRNKISSLEEYLEIIKNKTACFMAVCCQCGAMIDEHNEEVTLALKEYGLNFGISYQLMDDYMDGDATITSKINMLETAREYAVRAIKYLEILDNSEYKDGLKNLAEYVISPSKRSSTVLITQILKNDYTDTTVVP
ncbi:MAG: polyprenyl synthetase family protein [Elusimicrobia bacterium]|nr:polyprenyl synthetase family protein [Elusimicrobiota bacterium]